MPAAPTVSTVRRRRVHLLAAAAVLVAALAGCSGKNAVDSTAANPKGFIEGDGAVHVVAMSDRHQVDGLAGRTLDGRTLDAGDWAGDVVVVNFWASWCGPCRSEAQSLQAVADKTAPLGVRFVGVNFKDDTDNAKAFVRKFGVSYPSIEDQPGRMGLHFRPTPVTTPTTIVLDRQHREAARISGEARYTTLLALVQKIAAEARGGQQSAVGPQS